MKTSLAERAAARRGEEDRRKRDAGELLRLRGRVRELEARISTLQAMCQRAFNAEALGCGFGEAFRAELAAAGRGQGIVSADAWTGEGAA